MKSKYKPDEFITKWRILARADSVCYYINTDMGLRLDVVSLLLRLTTSK